VLGHETELNRLVPAGGFCAVQVSPPVVVPMIVEPTPSLPLLPTATQSSESEQEILVTSTALDIPRVQLSSGQRNLVVSAMGPSDTFVVGAVVAEASVEDPDEAIPECTEGSVMGIASCPSSVVEGPCPR